MATRRGAHARHEPLMNSYQPPKQSVAKIERKEDGGYHEVVDKIATDFFVELKVGNISIITDPLAEECREILTKELEKNLCLEQWEFIQRLYALNLKEEVSADELHAFAHTYIFGEAKSVNVGHATKESIKQSLALKPSVKLFEKVAFEVFQEFVKENMTIKKMGGIFLIFYDKAKKEQLSLQKRGLAIYLRLENFISLKKYEPGDPRFIQKISIVAQLEKAMNDAAIKKSELAEFLKASGAQSVSALKKALDDFCQNALPIFKALDGVLPKFGDQDKLNAPNLELMINCLSHPSPVIEEEDFAILFAKIINRDRPLKHG